MVLDTSEKYDLVNLIEYQDNSVVSIELMKKQTGTVTLFAFDKGEGLSEHTAPFDAMIQVLDGTLELTLGGQLYTINEGEMIIMPRDVPHALLAQTKLKILLTMIKS
ncbi:MAG: cupin [Methanosphaera sp. rholeuAM74]|nr:MAG: cupin [Methanosphaera sp. rholeuAM74]